MTPHHYSLVSGRQQAHLQSYAKVKLDFHKLEWKHTKHE